MAFETAIQLQNHTDCGAGPHALIGITDAQTCLNLTGRLRALRQAGFRVTLVSNPGDWLASTAAEQSVESIAIPMRRSIAPLSDFVSLLRLLRLLQRLRPSLTEFSSPKAGLLGSVAAWLVRVPVRVYMLRGFKLDTSTGLKRFILLQAERLAAACSHVVLCNSESLRAEAIALRVAPPEKLHLLGRGSSNGIDVERFSSGPSHVRQQLGLRPETPLIGFVGRLTRDKGIPELVEAFDQILAAEPAARLVLVGWFDHSEDALAPALRRRIERHPHIHLTGYVKDTVPYYRAMDLLVLPTWREGFPNVVLEAAAAGLPVVTTESTGSRDSVVPEVTGFLIPPGYPQAIAEAVLKLLRDPARRRMGHAARAWVTQNFSHTLVLGRTTEFYLDLVRQSQTRRR